MIDEVAVRQTIEIFETWTWTRLEENAKKHYGGRMGDLANEVLMPEFPLCKAAIDLEECPLLKSGTCGRGQHHSEDTTLWRILNSVYLREGVNYEIYRKRFLGELRSLDRL